MKLTHCKSPACGAPIVWCRTDHGKKMPVDADPLVAKGGERGFVLDEDDPEQPVAHYVKAAQPGQALYQAHWATCPSQRDFRRQPNV